LKNRSVGVQFAKDGPFIPTELLHALEKGDLVVFCGAGISRYLGLPDFKGLVARVCEVLNRPLQPDEEQIQESGAFDLALGLIENRIGKALLRFAVRRVLDVNKDADLSTHKALLQLATTKRGQNHLVTTNFDRAFEFAQSGGCVFDYAPYLPTPDTTWSSVIHLHGGLGDPRDLNGSSLVFTSADFGRAYITEAWASRFLSELFRRASAILFVGYSVSDPAVRYIVDAFAADRSGQTDRIAKAYLLIGGSDNTQTWSNRGIEPIVYDPREGHRLLHETLKNFAKRYRSGFFDRESIVLEYGTQSPLGGLDSEAISQITWALGDKSGHAARCFADLIPSPPIDWLDILEEADLLKMAPDSPQIGGGYSPVTPAPTSQFIIPLEPIAFALCRWMTNHLGESRFINWVLKRGAHLHPFLAETIRTYLDSGKGPTLPHGTRILWDFLAAEHAPIFSQRASHEALVLPSKIGARPWSPLLRDLALTWLAPTIRIQEPFLLEGLDQETVGANADVALTPAAGEYSWYLARHLLARPDADEIGRDLLGDLTRFVERGFTYLKCLDQARSDYDRSYSSLPSVDDHPQNDRLHHWPVYIHLIREFWTRMSVTDPARAREEVACWMRGDFPIFRRLVLWSAAKPGGLVPSESVEYLSARPSSAIWGLDTHREFLQYLARVGPLLSPDDAQKLTGLIIVGPPRAQFIAALSDEEFREIQDREIHIRLAKLRDGGLTLPSSAQDRLDRIVADHPTWNRPTNERDEFIAWFTAGHIVPDAPELKLEDYRGWSDDAVLADLRVNATKETETSARWRWLLSEDARRAIRILNLLGETGTFETATWSLALDYLNREETRSECVALFGTFVVRLGNEFVLRHIYQLSSLIDAYARAKIKDNDQAFWALWDVLLPPSADYAFEQESDPAFAALNSSIGYLTESLLKKLGELNPATYDELSAVGVSERLENLLTGTQPGYRLSRLLLAKALAWLFRINPDLARATLVDRMNWDTSPDAKLIWTGYLWSPRITPELWAAMEPNFLATFPHSPELGQGETPFYALFAFLLLHEEFTIDAVDARGALTNGSPKGRSQVAWYWWRQAESASEYGATLFRERLNYLLTNVWPIEIGLREENSSCNLALLASSCGSAFPDAVATISPMLIKIEDSQMFLSFFKDKDHAEKYPEASLALVDSVVGQQISVWSWPDLRDVLNRISAAQPNLRNDPRFLRLDELVRQFE
jgi:hypothetical protein